jgi:hypothetical protein
MARSISSLAGYGMDYIEDIVAYVAPTDHVSPLKLGQDKNEAGDTKEPANKKEDAFFDDTPEGKESVSVLSEALKMKIESEMRVKKKLMAEAREAKRAKIEACIAKMKPAPKHCQYCDRAPCVMDEHYDHLMAIGTEMDEDFDNKEIRYAMYREMSNTLWGPLGKGVRKQLPKCVVAEIHDAYPTRRGEKYVGFRPYDSYKSVTVMSDSDEEE